MRQSPARLIGAFSCLSKLKFADPSDLLSGQYDLGRCYEDSIDQKFCLVHMGMDPLPVALSVGSCIPDECGTRELADLGQIICAIPSCQLLAPFEDFQTGFSLTDICGIVQRAICGPDDRTMMQHHISLTCVPPEKMPSAATRRKLSSTEVASISTTAVHDWIADFDSLIREDFDKIINSLNATELVHYVQALVDDLFDFAADEVKKFWKDIREDFEADSADLASLFSKTSKEELAQAIDRIRSRVRMRLSAMDESLQRIADHIRHDNATEHIREIIDNVTTALQQVHEHDVDLIKTKLQDIKEALQNWLNKHGHAKSQPRASHTSQEVRELGDWINDLEAAGSASEEWTLLLRRISRTIENLRILTKSNSELFEEDIRKLISDFRQYVQDLISLLDPAETTADSTLTAASTTIMSPSTTSEEVFERRLWQFFKKEGLIEDETTSTASSTADSAVTAASTRVITTTTAGVKEHVEQLRQVLRQLFESLRTWNEDAIKTNFGAAEDLLRKIGADVYHWSEKRAKQAQEQLRKFVDELQRKIIDADARKHLDPEIEARHLLDVLLAPDSDSGDEDRPSLPDIVQSLVSAVMRLSEDSIKLTAKSVVEVGADETIRRDLAKVNKQVSRMASRLTADQQDLVNRWRKLIESDLESIATSIRELEDRVRASIDARMQADKEYRDALIVKIKDFGQGWDSDVERLWLRLKNLTDSTAANLNDEARRWRDVVESEVKKSLENFKSFITDVHNDLSEKLQTAIENLKQDIDSLVKQLKEIVHHFTSTTTTTTPVPTTTSSGYTSTLATITTTFDKSSARASTVTLPHERLLAAKQSDMARAFELALGVLTKLGADSTALTRSFDNTTLTLEIISHLAPKLAFRDLSEEPLLWVSQKRLEAVFNCGSRSNQDLSLLINSGHTPQSLGAFETCLGSKPAESDHRYCFVRSAGLMGQGRCVAKVCDDDALKETTAFICSWLKHGRSCLELINIIPVDYCIFTEAVSCGQAADIPDVQDLRTVVRLPAWYGDTAALEGSWWSSLNLLQRYAQNMKISMTAFEMPEIFSWTGQHTNSRLLTQLTASDYNITEITGESSTPTYQISCSRAEDSYWTKRSAAGLILIILFLVLLPAASHFRPELKAWQPLPNISQWLKQSSKNSQLSTSAIHGMRVISIWWIIWGHTLATILFVSLIENYEDTIDIIRSFSMQGVISGVFAVDTFFGMSAFLLAFKSERLFSRLKEARHHKIWIWSKTVVYAVYKRWARLSPPYYFILAVYILSIPYLANGPIYPAFSNQILHGNIEGKNGCLDNWYYHVLYLDNLFPQDGLDECMGWSWYLANEFQLGILGICMVGIAYVSQKGYWRLWWLLVITSYLVSTVSEIQHHFDLGFITISTADSPENLIADVAAATTRQRTYIRPWPRVPGYLISLTAGLYLASREKVLAEQQPSSIPAKPKGQGPHTEPLMEPEATPMILKRQAAERQEPQPAPQSTIEPIPVYKAWLGHILALGIMVLLMWTPWIKSAHLNKHWPYPLTVLYNVLARSIWTLCLVWFIYIFQLSYYRVLSDPVTGALNKVLSSHAFAMLAPLVYTTYLVHMIIQSMYYASVGQSSYVSTWEGFHDTLGWIPLSFGLALVPYILVEIPFTKVL